MKFDRDLSLEILLSASATSAATASAEPSPKSPKVPASPIARPRGNTPKATPGNCDPPFYFENGIKVYKPGCL
ncbi:MAG: hypothetical protein QM784_24180 [Polyangiaceae bacterium]